MNESNNGTATSEVNGEATETNRLPKAKKTAKAKDKTKPSKFAELWASAYDNGDGGNVAGSIDTTEGKVKVIVKCFPSAIDAETYVEAAASEGCTASFALSGRVVKGVKLKNATRKLEGVGAEAFLDKCEEMYDAADES